MKFKLFNFIAFQCCWFANVLGAAHAMPWIGPAVTAAWISAHFMYLPNRACVEVRLLVCAALIGWIADSTLVLSGLLAFPEAARLGAPSTLWMVCLWVCFAATMRHSLGWLRDRWLLGAVLGGIGGPVAYLGGQSLGAISLSGNTAIAAVALEFALATPILLLVVRYAEGAARISADDTSKGVQS